MALNSECTAALHSLQQQLLERDHDVQVAAKIGESLLDTIQKLQHRIAEMELLTDDFPRSSSSRSQLSLLELDVATLQTSLKGFVGKITAQSSSSPRSSSPDLLSQQSSLKPISSHQSFLPKPSKIPVDSSKQPRVSTSPTPQLRLSTTPPSEKPIKYSSSPTELKPRTSLITPTRSSIQKPQKTPGSPTPRLSRPKPKSMMDRLQQSNNSPTRTTLNTMSPHKSLSINSSASHTISSTGFNGLNTSSGLNTSVDDFGPLDETLITQARNLQLELSIKVGEVKELQEKCDSLEKCMDGLRSRNEKLSRNEAQFEERIWNLEVQLAQTTEAKNMLEAQLERYLHDIESLKATIRMYTDQLEQLRSQEQSECERLQTTHETITAVLRREIANLQKENRSLLQQLDSMYDAENEPHSYESSHSRNSSLSQVEEPENTTIMELHEANVSLAYAADQVISYKNMCDQLLEERNELRRLLAEAQETIERVTMEYGRYAGSIRSGSSWNRVDHPTLLKELSRVDGTFGGYIFNGSLKSAATGDSMQLENPRMSLDNPRMSLDNPRYRERDLLSLLTRSERSHVSPAIISPTPSEILQQLPPREEPNFGFLTPKINTEMVKQEQQDQPDQPDQQDKASMKSIASPNMSPILHHRSVMSLTQLDVSVAFDKSVNATQNDTVILDPQINETQISSIHGDTQHILDDSMLQLEDLDGDSPTTATNNQDHEKRVSDTESNASSSVPKSERYSNFTLPQAVNPAQLLSDLASMKPGEEHVQHVRLVGVIRGQEKEEKMSIPQVPVQALAATMIGGWFQKYNRFNKHPQMRFVWVNPYSRTLFWAPYQPSQSKHKSRHVRTAYIESFSCPPAPTSQNVPPSPEHHILIKSPDREIKLVPLSWTDREQWNEGLSLLLQRSGSRTPVYEQFKLVDANPQQKQPTSIDEPPQGTVLPALPHPNDPGVVQILEKSKLPPRSRQQSISNSFSVSFNSTFGSSVSEEKSMFRRPSVSRLLSKFRPNSIVENEEREVRRSRSMVLLGD